MCFSAPASFVTAAVTAIAGAAAVRQAQDRREVPLASIPLFFAAQQAVEGLLWLAAPVSPDAACPSVLTGTFLIFALVFWPVYAPLATLLVEPEPARRRLIGGCLVIGVGVAAYLLHAIFTASNGASIMGGHIVYESDPPPSPLVGPFYLAATGLAPALSSHRALNLLALIVIAGSLIAWFMYWEAFVSVWCFFAAAASAVILVHFARARSAAAAPALPSRK